MTRSRRHTPIHANTTAVSDKWTKMKAHRAARAAERACLALEADGPHPKAFGNPWKSQKDGKRYMVNPKQEWMRK